MQDVSRTGLPSSWRVGVVLNATLALMLAALWVFMGVKGLFWRADFRAFYTGWTMVLDGQGARLYDLDLQDDYQARVLPERPPNEGLLPFVNPPHSALVLAPLALLSRPAAFAVWTLLQVGLCGVAAWLLLRLGDCHERNPWLLLVTVLAFPPLFMSFQQGQVSLLCFVCLLGFVVALKADRPFLVACCIVAGTIKPQLMVIPCVLLLALRRWRDLAWVAGLFGLWATVTGFVLGWESWRGFFAILRFSSQQSGTGGVDPLIMYNLKGLLTGLLGRGLVGTINVLVVAAWLVSVPLVLWLWRKPGALQSVDADLRLALTFLLGVIVNPHLNPTDALTLVLPALLFLGWLRRQDDSRSAEWFGVLLVGSPLLFLADCYLIDISVVRVRPFFVLMLALLGWMAWRVGERRTEAWNHELHGHHG